MAVCDERGDGKKQAGPRKKNDPPSQKTRS